MDKNKFSSRERLIELLMNYINSVDKLKKIENIII